MRTLKLTNYQRHILPGTTSRTDFARLRPAVHLNDLCACLGSRLLQDSHKLGKTQVGYLPAPHPFHPRQVQRLQADEIETFAQVTGQLPIAIPAIVEPFCFRLTALFKRAISVSSALRN
jgi:hypothetical protein